MNTERILQILYLHSDIEDSGAKCYMTKEQFEKAAQEIDKLYSRNVDSNNEVTVCDHTWVKGRVSNRVVGLILGGTAFFNALFYFIKSMFF